jgi:hypothetical protein
MITTLSFDEAVEKCPAIAASSPASFVSNKYSFIPTGQIIQKALEKDWLIREVKGGKGVHGVHTVKLIHKSQLDHDIEEGFPQLNIINSHNRTKRFSQVIGFYRLICSNGLIAPAGLTYSTSPTLHRAGRLNMEQLSLSFSETLNQFNDIIENTKLMKDRNLSEEERMMLAQFSYYIRFRYRMFQPKKVDVKTLLQPRRSSDNGTDLWTTFNVLQENITHGGAGIGRGISRLEDDLRFNQELWTGVNSAISHKNEDLSSTLKNLFPKKERIGRKALSSDI